jgi:hypothetical protein
MQPNLKTLSFYRRLLKSMMKTYSGDFEMFHRYLLKYEISIGGKEKNTRK